ncbi:MAG: hypothetical protein ACXWFO_08340, partial [Candidatus Aminicenantales bacterium]
MKAKVVMLLAVGLCFMGAQAQDELIKKIDPLRSYDGVVEFQKTRQAARIFEFNYPAKDLDKAVEGYLVSRGGKVRNVKGFNVVKGILLHDSENKVYDVYYKVDGKGKGDNATSILSVILADPDEDVLLRAQPKAGVSSVTQALHVFSGAGAAGFFDGLGTYVGDYEYGKAVAVREEEFKKAEKRYSDLVDEGQSLVKKRQKLEQDISDNSDAQ